MRHFPNRRSGGRPPFINPAFADALAGQSQDHRARRKENHKSRQLCRQVERALTMALAGECGDDVLRELYIIEVTPAPSASHLLVRVSIPAHVPVADALAQL